MAILQASKPDNTIGQAHLDANNNLLTSSSGDTAAPRKRARGLITTSLAVVPIPTGTKVVKLECSVLTQAGVGATATPSATVQQAWTITKGDATSGNFTATFQGRTSGNIAWNSSAASAVAAMVALTSVGAGGVTGAGGTLDVAPIVLTTVAGILEGVQPNLVITTVDLAGGVSAASRLPTVAITTPAVTSSGFVETGTEFIFPLAATDTNLYITGDSGAGTYRASFLS